MSTDTLEKEDTFTTGMGEFETDFAKTCNVAEECDKQAVWSVWARHAAEMCPFSGYACEEHKQAAEKMWIHIMTCGKHTCGRCQVRIPIGFVKDNFRFIKL